MSVYFRSFATLSFCLLSLCAINIPNQDWELCVPTDMFETAAAILKTEPFDKVYELYKNIEPQLYSLLHTFPRFKLRGYTLWFDIIPSQDCYLDCEPSNFEWSKNGIPYPKLDVFAQSLLRTNSVTNLTDLVDGMNLTEEWGWEHLDLSGSNDVVWAQEKNEKIRASVPLTLGSCFLELDEGPFSLEETWKEIVQRKRDRIGLELPKERFETRFRPRGSGDPRSGQREDA